MIREIVKIDEEKCDGCGLCVPSCAEGAIQIIEGKARLVSDNLCDGLGACLGDCPRGAITIEKRQADAFDEEAVEKHLQGAQPPHAAKPAPQTAHEHGHGGGCPGSKVMSFAPAAGGGCPGSAVRSVSASKPEGSDVVGTRPSQLRQWPVQMHLVPPTAPFLQGADLVFAADCVPFAYADFHKDFLQGKALLVGCPKLDDSQAYLKKLTEMLTRNDIRSLTVLHMEVPCCSGLIMIVRQALAASGKDIPLQTIKISIQGERMN